MSRFAFILALLSAAMFLTVPALAQQPPSAPGAKPAPAVVAEKKRPERPNAPELDWREFICATQAECMLGWEINTERWNKYVQQDTEWIRTDPLYTTQRRQELAVQAYASLPRAATATFPSDDQIVLQERQMAVSIPGMDKTMMAMLLHGIYGYGKTHPDKIRAIFVSRLAEIEQAVKLCNTPKGETVNYREACGYVQRAAYHMVLPAMAEAIANEKRAKAEAPPPAKAVKVAPKKDLPAPAKDSSCADDPWCKSRR